LEKYKTGSSSGTGFLLLFSLNTGNYLLNKNMFSEEIELILGQLATLCFFSCQY
jgi:hypothetical protein